MKCKRRLVECEGTVAGYMWVPSWLDRLPVPLCARCAAAARIELEP